MIRRSNLWGLLLALCSVIGSGPAKAQTLGPVVYDRALTGSNAVNGWSSEADVGFHQLQKMTLADTATIGGARWWGAYGPGGPVVTTDSFTIRIYGFSSGVPDVTPIHSFVVGHVNRTASGTIGPTLTQFRYETNYPAITLAPGTYGFSIQNQTPTSVASWIWSQRDTTGGRFSKSTGSWVAASQSLAFQLTGEASSAVPEPGSATLLLPALAFLALLRRRTGRS